MEDFLKDRPSISSEEAGAPASPSAAPVVTPHGAFAQIRREAARPAAAGHAPLAVAADAQQLTGEHGTHVQTVVERGRVTKIIVTCTCGKTTEIACSY